MSAQKRPACPVCGRWKRRDHRCPKVRVKPAVPVASTKGLPKMRHV